MNASPHPMDLVAAHFSGRISQSEERALRAHLPECESCRAYYDRHLLLAELDPSALTAERRLARGLGLSLRRNAEPRWGFLLALAAAAFSVSLVWLRSSAHPESLPGATRALVPKAAAHSTAVSPEFEARGDALRASAELLVYRLRAGEPPALVRDVLAADDELAFAYLNPGGFEHLLVFGVDEHHHVYWYHPAWSNGATDPIGVSLVSGPHIHELPEAVRQGLDGASVRIIALFSHQAVSVRAIEQELDNRWQRGAGLSSILPGALQTELSLQVRDR